MPELEGLKLVVHLDASARTGRTALGASLAEYLRRSLGGLVDSKALKKAQSRLRLKSKARSTPKGLAAAGRVAGAAYVLSVSIERIGWKYRATANLVNTQTAEVQMDFRSEYYKPQLEAGDRGVRIAKTTVGKLLVLRASKALAQAPKPTARPKPKPKPESEPKKTTAPATATSPAPEDSPPSVAAPIEPEAVDESTRFTADTEVDLDGSGGSNDSLLAELGLLGETEEDGIVQTDEDMDTVDSVLHRIDIGGELYLGVHYDAYERGAASDYPVTSPNIFEVSVDSGPAVVRAYIEGRVAARFASTSTPALGFDRKNAEAEVLLDQVWVEFNIEEALFVKVGRQDLEFGTGRFWRPTNVLAPAFLDPLALYDHRVGADLLVLRVPFDSVGLSLLAIGGVDDITEPLDASATGRIEWKADRTQLSATVTGARNQPLQIGVDLATGFGGFGLHLEGALMHGVRTPRWTGEVRWNEGVWPTAESVRDDWITRIVAGADYVVEYGSQDRVVFGGEYMYNQAGYDSADLYAWLIANGQFVPYYVGRHYAALFLSVPDPGSWDGAKFDLRGIGNLSDQSFTTQLDISAELLGALETEMYLRLDILMAVSFGSAGEFRLALDVPPVPGHPMLWAGLSRPSEVFSIGAGLALGF